MLLDSVVAALPYGSFQLLSRLITEAAFPANLAALQMLQSRLDKELELNDSRLPAIVSSLIKVGYIVHTHTQLTITFQLMTSPLFQCSNRCQL